MQLQIQRLARRDPDIWTNWETPPLDRVEAHKTLIKTSGDWPKDMFRLVMITTEEIEFAKNGELLQRNL